MGSPLEAFKACFRFDPARAGWVGVEREAFIVDSHMLARPVAPAVLAKLCDPRFINELSACQIEARTTPTDNLVAVEDELYDLDARMKNAARACGMLIDYTTVFPFRMPLDVYPEERYTTMTRDWPRERLDAACRIIGTHIHVGMRDHESALRAYNAVLKNLPGLRGLGDLSNGRRLAIYRSVAPTMDPPPFDNWAHLHRYARGHGFEHDVRKWWGLVRISCHGTLEFRLFDATEAIPVVMKQVRTCRALCLAA